MKSLGPSLDDSNCDADDGPITCHFLDQVAVMAIGGEIWRIRRLHYVLGYLAAHPGINTLALRCIESIRDHKGYLTTVWRREPDAAWREAIEDAWFKFDGTECVYHEVVDAPLPPTNEELKAVRAADEPKAEPEQPRELLPF